MAYDPDLAARVRAALGKVEVVEKKMFGGIAFLLSGNMCCGVAETKVVLRLGKEGAADALGEPDISPMDFTGKPISTMVYFSVADDPKDRALRKWVRKAVKFSQTLPKK